MNNNFSEPKKFKSVLSNKVIKEELKNIPDNILMAFTKRSIRDAEKLSTPEEDFEKISYALYRSYCIGYIMAKLE